MSQLGCRHLPCVSGMALPAHFPASLPAADAPLRSIQDVVSRVTDVISSPCPTAFKVSLFRL